MCCCFGKYLQSGSNIYAIINSQCVLDKRLLIPETKIGIYSRAYKLFFSTKVLSF